MEPRERLITYGVYSRLIDDIKHYDSVQATYRTMTSSLLLASFAAIGFLYSLKPESLPINLSIWVLCICLIALAAITTMAILDLVYQERLMIANTIEALKLEAKCDWLPKIHHQMLSLKTHPASPNRKSWFYIGCGVSLILIAGRAVVDFALFSHVIMGIIWCMTVLFSFLYGTLIYRGVNSFEKLIEGHFDYKQIKTMGIERGTG